MTPSNQYDEHAHDALRSTIVLIFLWVTDIWVLVIFTVFILEILAYAMHFTFKAFLLTSLLFVKNVIITTAMSVFNSTLHMNGTAGSTTKSSPVLCYKFNTLEIQ